MLIEDLFLVDRKKTRSLWWTSDNPCVLLVYKSKDAAEFCKNRLKRNKPRVVEYSYALSVLQKQREFIEEIEEQYE